MHHNMQYCADNAERLPVHTTDVVLKNFQFKIDPEERRRLDHTTVPIVAPD